MRRGGLIPLKRPPGSEGFEFTDEKGVTWIHPGYKGSPERWKKGTEPEKIGWYAGAQYDGDIARAKQVLAELDKHYPGAKEYEVAGFFWWQGDRDSRSAALSSRYEQNLVHLIKQLRKEFQAPSAKFVCATVLPPADKAMILYRLPTNTTTLTPALIAANVCQSICWINVPPSCICSRLI